MFTIYLGTTKDASKMWIGGYNETYIKKGYTADEL